MQKSLCRDLGSTPQDRQFSITFICCSAIVLVEACILEVVRYEFFIPIKMPWVCFDQILMSLKDIFKALIYTLGRRGGINRMLMLWIWVWRMHIVWREIPEAFEGMQELEDGCLAWTEGKIKLLEDVKGDNYYRWVRLKWDMNLSILKAGPHSINGLRWL